MLTKHLICACFFTGWVSIAAFYAHYGVFPWKWVIEGNKKNYQLRSSKSLHAHLRLLLASSAKSINAQIGMSFKSRDDFLRWLCLFLFKTHKHGNIPRSRPWNKYKFITQISSCPVVCFQEHYFSCLSVCNLHFFTSTLCNISCTTDETSVVYQLHPLKGNAPNLHLCFSQTSSRFTLR